MPTLQEQFGQIDIYLFDQLLKGRISPGMRILDAGCGSGRNLVYFLREGYEVYAVDPDVQAVERPRPRPDVRPRASRLEFLSRSRRTYVLRRCVRGCGDLQHRPLFCARRRAPRVHAARSVAGPEARRLFFCRLGSSIGMDSQIEHIGGRRYKSPDGSERYLVDEALLGSLTERFGAELADPVKTTVVQNQRSMTTWVVRKKLL